MPDFNEIKQKCHGMMKPEVYEKIYNTALKTSGNIFLEIGTAHGAATVCLAKALQDSGRPNGIVYSFDKFDKVQRPIFDAVPDHLSFVKDILNKFEVEENVKLIAGNIKETYKEFSDKEISLFMLDSDGQIDRDFNFFFDKVKIGGSIIIDDMADRIRVLDKLTHWKVDQKHKLTYHLTKSAEKYGLIKNTDMEYQTWFGIKLKSKMEDWPQSKIISAYRELVFGTLKK